MRANLVKNTKKNPQIHFSGFSIETAPWTQASPGTHNLLREDRAPLRSAPSQATTFTLNAKHRCY